MSGTLAVPASEIGIGTSTLALYNWNPATQLAGFLEAETTLALGGLADPTILALGDSTTSGVGGDPSGSDYRQAFSYPAELAAALSQDGLVSQQDNYFGEAGLGVDARLAAVGNPQLVGNTLLGGTDLETVNPGDGVQFTLVSPGSYDLLSVYDISAGGTIAVAATLASGAVYRADVAVPLTYPGALATQTVGLPAGNYASVSIEQAGSIGLSIEGAAFDDTSDPETQVVNGGVAGQDSSIGTYDLTGYGGINTMAAAVDFVEQDGAGSANIVLIDYGINDILNYPYGPSPDQTAADIGDMVEDFLAAGAEPVIVLPEPIPGTAYMTDLPTIRAGLEALAVADDVPLIDLSATYGDDYSALASAGLIYDGSQHPDGELYSDIARQIAQTLTTAVYTAEITGLYGQVLDRAPDPGGLTNSVAQLFAGGSLTTIRAEMATSQEAATDINDLYQTVLGRGADPGGFSSKTYELATGESLTAIRTEMAVSAEAAGDLQAGFASAYGAAVAPSANQIAALQQMIGDGASLSSAIAEISAEALGVSASPTFVYLPAGGAVASSGDGETFRVVFSALTDVVSGFNIAADTLQVSASLFPSIQALLAATTQTGAGVVIGLPQGSVELAGVSLSGLTQRDVALV